MLKLFLMCSIVNLNVSTEYIGVESIEYYQTNNDQKQIIFNFDSDYYTNHKLEVEIKLYEKESNTLIKGYKNTIEVIGDKKSTANLSIENNEDMYVLIYVKYNENSIVKDAKLNLYVQDDCYLNKENRDCNRIYKSEYRNNISKDLSTKFFINKNIFDKYLTFNYLELNDFKYYSEYNFNQDSKYLIIYNYIESYDMLFDEKYRFILEIGNDKKFYLLEDYFVDLFDFKYSDEYFQNSKKTDKIYFPFFNDEKIYKISILIESFINIQIDFNVITSGNLLGSCKDSKFCLKRLRI